MRIIAGKYRRRRLQSNPGLTTRPITDRVKESLFENIGQRVPDRRVADIFSGTGTIGLEALSRGAEHVTFIEKDRGAVDLLRENIETLGCQSETFVWPADVLRCSFHPKGKQADEFRPWGLIFFDPPYKMVPRIKEGSPLWQAMGRLARPDVSEPDAALVLRVPERVDFDLPEEWQIHWTLEAAKMQIHVCVKSDAGAASSSSV